MSVEAAPPAEASPEVAQPSPYDPLTCPMPWCSEPLHIEWHRIYILSVGDLTEHSLPTPEDAAVGTWWVACLDGHRVLTPGPVDPDDEVNYESDELRTFRGIDRDALAKLLDTMRQAAG